MKAAFVALLFLAAYAFAARLTCTSFYAGVNALGDRNKESKLCGNITDEQGEAIISDMGEWSGGRFRAQWSKAGRGRMNSKMLNVVNVDEAADSYAATEETQAMQHLIRQHT